MTRIQPALEKRLSQAHFFCELLDKSRKKVPDREYYASAFLMSFRSVVFYLKVWLHKDKKISKDAVDAKIKSWESLLPASDREIWEYLIRARNHDIHEEPVIPDDAPAPGKTLGYYEQGFFKPIYFKVGATTLTIKHPKTQKEYDLFDACKVAIRVAEKLIAGHDIL